MSLISPRNAGCVYNRTDVYLVGTWPDEKALAVLEIYAQVN
jgi:hypothetical protein